MREIKRGQLQYYCNSCGELHDRGTRMLDQVCELPLMLQRPYLEFWTECLSSCCYIVLLGKQPGLLLTAEFDDDYCKKLGIPTEYDAQYAVLYGYGERLEKLACEINPHTIIGLSYEDACNPQLMMFIPTESVPFQDIPKLYYLMDQYAYQMTPCTVHWTVQELSEFIKQLHLDSEVEQRLLSGLDTEVTLGDEAEPADYMFQYMGMEIDRRRLYSRQELIKLVQTHGGSDRSLETVRDVYTQQFGNHLLWKYPFSDDMQGGGTIIPVQEGFLFLPYSSVYEYSGSRYQLNNDELLTETAIQTFQTECKAYVDGLLAALTDMKRAIQVRPIKRYIDKQGNLYFVRAGIGDVYKGFRHYAAPKKGQRRESGIRSLSYVKEFWRAQLELDQYAEKNHLRQLSDSEFQKWKERGEDV